MSLAVTLATLCSAESVPPGLVTTRQASPQAGGGVEVCIGRPGASGTPGSSRCAQVMVAARLAAATRPRRAITIGQGRFLPIVAEFPFLRIANCGAGCAQTRFRRLHGRRASELVQQEVLAPRTVVGDERAGAGEGVYL